MLQTSFLYVDMQIACQSHLAHGILHYYYDSLLVFYHFLVFMLEKILFLPETSPPRGYLNTAISGLNICSCGTLNKQILGDAGHGASLYKPLKINSEPSRHTIKSTKIKAAQEIITHR